MSDEIHVAGDVDSWCTKCKMWLAHTVVAMVAGTPKRVLCNTCHGEHAYRPHPPGEKPTAKKAGVRKGRAAAKPTRAKVSEWETRVGGLDRRAALLYKPKEPFAAEHLLAHPKFGLGLVLRTLDDRKINVLFESGEKILVHAR